MVQIGQVKRTRTVVRWRGYSWNRPEFVPRTWHTYSSPNDASPAGTAPCALLCTYTASNHPTRVHTVYFVLLSFDNQSIISRTSQDTRKRGKDQRVARPACANATIDFLLTYRLAMLLPPSEWPLKTSAQRTCTTTHANEPQDLRGYWTKVHQIYSRSNFFIDGVNATIRAVIRPPVVKWQGKHFKKKLRLVKHKFAGGIAMPGGLTI